MELTENDNNLAALDEVLSQLDIKQVEFLYKYLAQSERMAGVAYAFVYGGNKQAGFYSAIKLLSSPLLQKGLHLLRTRQMQDIAVTATSQLLELEEFIESCKIQTNPDRSNWFKAIAEKSKIARLYQDESISPAQIEIVLDLGIGVKSSIPITGSAHSQHNSNSMTPSKILAPKLKQEPKEKGGEGPSEAETFLKEDDTIPF